MKIQHLTLFIVIVYFSCMSVSSAQSTWRQQNPKKSNIMKSKKKQNKGFATDIDHKLNFKSKRGIGLIQTLSGAEGLGVQWGIGRLFLLETVLGATLVEHASLRNEILMTSALGLHFQLMQAQDVVSLTGGIRYNYMFGEICSIRTVACSKATVNPQNISEHVWGLPIRIMWFPIAYLSIHTEFGVTLHSDSISNQRLDVTQERTQDFDSGWRLEFFRQPSWFGRFGMIFWFI